MFDPNKVTAGQIIGEHNNKRLELEDDIIEYRRAMEPDIIKRLNDTAAAARIHPLYAGKDFYVIMVTIIDRIFRQPVTKIFARKSCPTPVYKQSVWQYRAYSGDLDFLWTIPDEILYRYVLANGPKYLQDKETEDLAKFCFLMESGELLDWVLKANGEKRDAVIYNNEEKACTAMSNLLI